MTVRATQAQDTELDLHYAVPLVGINADVRKIFINRSLEPAQTITSKEFHYNYYYYTLRILSNILEPVSQQKIDEDTTQPSITGDTIDTGEKYTYIGIGRFYLMGGGTYGGMKKTCISELKFNVTTPILL